VVTGDCGGTQRAPRHVMRSVLAGILILAPTIATAGPITAGVSLGLAQSKSDALDDPNHTIGLFGRLAFTKRLAGQLELARFQSDGYIGGNMRTGTALLVVDLANTRHFVPTLVAGIGFDSEDTGCPTCTFQGTQTGHHIEGGFGLEYRSDGGFTLGADVRMGGRSLDSGSGGEPLMPLAGKTIELAPAPARFSEGEYRSARVTLGIRF
jgi:hypothetical protein